MLSNIFYFLGMIIFLFNFLILSKVGDYIYIKSFYTKFKKVTGKNPEKKDFSGPNYEFFNFLVLNSFITTSWFFIGLLSQNWLVFLSFFIYNPTFEYVSKSKIKLISKSSDFLRVFLNVVVVAILVINHFHLQLNLTQFILLR